MHFFQCWREIVAALLKYSYSVTGRRARFARPELWRRAPHPRRFRQRTDTNLLHQRLPALARNWPSRGPRGRGRSYEYDTCNHLTRLLIARHRANPPETQLAPPPICLARAFLPRPKGENGNLLDTYLPEVPRIHHPRIPFPPTSDSHGVQRTRGPRARDGRRVHLDSGGRAVQVRWA